MVHGRFSQSCRDQKARKCHQGPRGRDLPRGLVFSAIFEGGHNKNRSHAGRLLSLLVLTWLGLFLPLEAFDADADTGFESAVLQRVESVRSSESKVSPVPHSPAILPIRRVLPSVTWGLQTQPITDLNGSANHQFNFLRASHLCARSSIPGADLLPQQLDPCPTRTAALLTASPLAMMRAVVFLVGECEEGEGRKPSRQDHRGRVSGGTALT